jgi:AcrR family transcriptional regulator
MDAAVDLFAEKGYAQTSVDDICTAIGASRATFYLHFKTKRDALLNKWQDAYPGFVARYQELDRTLSRTGTVKEMRAWLLGWYDWWVENRSLLLAMQQASVVEPELVAELGEMADPAHLVDFMETYLTASSAAERERRRLRTTLLEIMTVEVLTFLVLQRADVDVDETFDFLAELWSDALRGSLGKPKRAAAQGGPAGAGARPRRPAGEDAEQRGPQRWSPPIS